MALAQHIEEYFTEQKPSHKMTDLPAQVAIGFYLKLPPEDAFKLLSVDLPKWINAIPSIEWDYRQSKSQNKMDVGTQRTCAFGKDKAHENIIEYQYPSYYAYQIDFDKSTMKMPISDHLGIFRVSADNKGGSICSWEQRFNKKRHPLSPILNFMMQNFVLKKFVKNLVKQHQGYIL